MVLSVREAMVHGVQGVGGVKRPLGRRGRGGGSSSISSIFALGVGVRDEKAMRLELLVAGCCCCCCW